MKKYFIALTFAFTVVCFALAGFFAKQAGNEGMTEYWTGVAKDATKQTLQRSVEIRLEAQQISELQLSVTNDDLRIEASPDDELHLLFTMRGDSEVLDESQILQKIFDGVYSIDLHKIEVSDKDVKVNFVNVFNFNVTVNDAEVIVQIPGNIKKIKASSVSGDMRIKLDAEELAANAVSGEIRVQGKIAKVNTKTISGDTRISLQAPAAQALLDTISGDVKVVVGSDPDFLLDFETTSGEMGFDQEMSKTHFDGSFKGFKFGNGSGKITIKTISGDARIYKETATE